MTPETLATLILGITGALVQLVFMYAPKLKDWFENNPNKGLIMLGVNLVVSLVYFALACSQWAAQLGIFLSCDSEGIFLLIKAFFIIASSQQLTYLFTKNSRAMHTVGK